MRPPDAAFAGKPSEHPEMHGSGAGFWEEGSGLHTDVWHGGGGQWNKQMIEVWLFVTEPPRPVPLLNPACAP